MTTAPPTKVELARKLLQLTSAKVLTPQLAADILGTRLGPEQQEGEGRFRWALRPTNLVSEGTAFKIGRNVTITFQPTPALDLTFSDVAQHYLDVPFAIDAPTILPADDPGSGVRRKQKAPRLFRVPAGELQVLLNPVSTPANSRRVVSITVNDNTFWEWPAETLRQRWAGQPEKPDNEPRRRPPVEGEPALID